MGFFRDQYKRKSDYPYRQKFFDLNLEEKREYNSYKEWVRDSYYGPVYDGINVENYRYRNPNEDKYAKKI